MAEKEKKAKIVREKMEDVEDITEVTLPLMYEYVKRKGPDAEDWLIEILEKKVPSKKKDKDGNTIMRNTTFIEQRNEFVKKYFPALAPEGTSKKTPVTKDILAELKARKAQRQ